MQKNEEKGGIRCKSTKKKENTQVDEIPATFATKYLAYRPNEEYIKKEEI